MKIEEGKTYIDREGTEHGPILSYNEGASRLFHIPGSWMWSIDGINLLCPASGITSHSKYDLVNEVHVVGIKVELGKSYLTKSGKVFGAMKEYEYKTNEVIQKSGDGFVWCALTGRNKASPALGDYPDGAREFDLIKESITLAEAELNPSWLGAELNCDDPLDLPLDADKPDFVLPEGVDLQRCKNCLTDAVKELDVSEAFLWHPTPQGATYWANLHADVSQGRITKLPFKARHYIKKIVAALEPKLLETLPPKRHRDGSMLIWFTGLTQAQREIIVKAESRTPIGTCPFAHECQYVAVKAILEKKDEQPSALWTAFSFSSTEQGWAYWELVAAAPYLRKLAEVMLRHWVEAWERGDRPLAPESEPAPPMTASAGIEEDDICPF